MEIVNSALNCGFDTNINRFSYYYYPLCKKPQFKDDVTGSSIVRVLFVSTGVPSQPSFGARQPARHSIYRTNEMSSTTPCSRNWQLGLCL